jgi:hypothetical protein
MNNKKRNARKIRYAVVGLGHLAQVAVLPAFAHLQNAEIAALVTRACFINRFGLMPVTYGRGGLADELLP